MTWLRCLVLGALVAAALAYPSGAPKSACATGSPGGPHGSAQTSGGDYTIKTDKPSFEPGQKLTVTLEGSAPFKGFMVRAFDKSGGSFGNFTTAQGYDAKTISCDQADDTITHISNAAKPKMVFYWHPPAGAGAGKVKLRAAVVKSKLEFWVDIRNASSGLRATLPALLAAVWVSHLAGKLLMN